MRRTIFIALLVVTWTILVPGQTQATDQCPPKSDYVAAVKKGVRDRTEHNWYVTKSGYVAAVNEELLDRAIFWALYGDEEDFDRFIDSSPFVFPLKGGVRVRLENYSYSGKVRIRPKGSTISVWTVREAIRLEFPIFGS